MTKKKDQTTAPTAPEGNHFAIQKIYTKDLSFEAPNTPAIFNQEWQPVVDIQLANDTHDLESGLHEVIITITVTVKFKDQVVYLIEVHQAGLFMFSGFTKEQIPYLLATACPNIIFPFAREIISDMVTRGGFPQLLLSPVNFEILYRQELERRSGSTTSAPAPH